MDRFEEVKLRVKEATDLVATVESYLPLKPRGRLLLALCPFHPEKTPSFTVYPESQHFHCFGCGKSGDVFTFLMEREGLSFREAMETLADRASISLDGAFGHGAARERQRGPDPHQVLGEVRAFLQQQLQTAAGEAARDYLDRRGLLDSVEAWALGFHPQEPGALRAFAQQRRLPMPVLEQAGMLRGRREPFAGRLMFPIDDERGRVCGFGGRVLPGAPPRDDGSEQPKYINSPESPFFNKRRLLYGLHQAKRSGQRRIVVVEGYTDVIACHLAGFGGAVASLGTAFTGEHCKKLERYAQQGVVLLFDGDRAGRQAAERAMRELINSRVTVHTALLAEAKDPADYVVAQAGEDPELVTERRARFADLIEGAEPALHTWFRLLRQRLDLSQAVDLETAARECADLLHLVDGDMRRRALLQEMARHLAMPAEALARMQRRRPERRAQQDDAAAEAAAAAGADGSGGAGGGADALVDLPPGIAGAAGVDVAPRGPVPPALRAERDILAAAIQAPELVGRLLDPELERAPLQSRSIGTLLGHVRRSLAQGRTGRAEVVRHVFAACEGDAGLSELLAAAIARGEEIGDPAAFLETLMADRQRALARVSARSLRQQLQDALARGDRATADRLTKELVDQMRQHRPRASG